MNSTRGKRVLAASLAAAVIAVVVGGILLSSKQDSQELVAPLPGELRSYEFVVEVSSGPLIPDKPNGLIRCWYEAPSRTRWELGAIDPKPGETAIIVVTESDFWFYDSDLGTYSHDAIPPGTPPAEGRPFPLISNLLIGTILPESFVDDALLQAAPREEMLGRTVAVFDSSDGRPLPRGLNRNVSLWVDLEYRLVLRELTDTAGGSYDARMVKLRLNHDLDDNVFRFEPPQGARAKTPEPTVDLTSIAQPRGTPFPSRLLKPAYVPDGMGVTDSRSSIRFDSKQETSKQTYTGRPGQMVLSQETVQSDALIPLGTPVAIDQVQGTYVVRGGLIVVNWIQDGVRLTLESDSIPLDELLKVARSMEPRP